MWRPETPFERRMRELSRSFPPPPWHPAHELLAARALLEGERDLRLREWWRELKEQVPPFMLSRLEGGTGFPLSNQLRHFFREDASRFMKHGPHSLPGSFNVVESFLFFSYKVYLFDLRPEHEHLLSFSEDLDWYTSGAFPEVPAALVDILPEGEVHSYNMVAPSEDFRLATPESNLILFGLGLVRHSTELSMMALVGESPPYLPDSTFDEIKEDGPRFRGKENIEPDPEYTVADRYHAEAPSFARVRCTRAL